MITHIFKDGSRSPKINGNVPEKTAMRIVEIAKEIETQRKVNGESQERKTG